MTNLNHISASMRRRCRSRATIKRQSIDAATGRASGLSTVATDVPTTYPVPASMELRQRAQLENAKSADVAFAISAEIERGDVLIIGSREYGVRLVGQWDDGIAELILSNG